MSCASPQKPFTVVTVIGAQDEDGNIAIMTEDSDIALTEEQLSPLIKDTLTNDENFVQRNDFSII